MIKLIIVRHGQSVYNRDNRFTGWTDCELSDLGKKQAINAGKILKEKGYTFDLAYTSDLRRAQDTLSYILKELDQTNIPVFKTWRLNERHYGALQGTNKDDLVKQYGKEQVQKWRRSYMVRPPELDENDKSYLDLKKIYKEHAPRTESLKDTIERVLPYWKEEILPNLKEGKKIIIAAHGNSLRGLIKYLDGISDDDIVGLEIEVGMPICYELDENIKPIRHYYIGNE